MLGELKGTKRQQWISQVLVKRNYPLQLPRIQSQAAGTNGLAQQSISNNFWHVSYCFFLPLILSCDNCYGCHVFLWYDSVYISNMEPLLFSSLYFKGLFFCANLGKYQHVCRATILTKAACLPRNPRVHCCLHGFQTINPKRYRTNMDVFANVLKKGLLYLVKTYCGKKTIAVSKIIK